jgi:Asp-tRNA(Asn)/Glu-tRNA(Gln) amidotransferase A subunit family amidase
VRLKKAGAILVGKLNLHEFALGGTSAITYFGAVHNPWALDHGEFVFTRPLVSGTAHDNVIAIDNS